MLKYNNTIVSKAKINLTLNVMDYDKDRGYHHLQSAVAFCHDLYDLVLLDNQDRTLGQFPQFSWKRAIGGTPAEGKMDYMPSIIKNIPFGAGFGGVSGIRANLANHISNNELENWIKSNKGQLCEEYGFDCEAFLYDKHVVVDGSYGEVSHTFEMPEIYVLLMWPRIEVSTPRVFEHYKLNPDKYKRKSNVAAKKITKIKGLIDLCDILEKHGNDLRACTLDIYPEVADFDRFICDHLNAEYIGMSGTGSGYFGIYSDFKAAAIDKEILNNANAWNFMTRI